MEDCGVEKLLDRIYQSLQKLIGLHRQLLETVRMEHEALAHAQLKEIQEAVCAKEALIAAIRQKESERVKCIAELALYLKRPARDLTLPEIIIAIQGTQRAKAEQFRSAFNALTILVQRIREQNDENRGLVERSLDHVQNMKKNVLGESVPRSDVYTNQGQKTGGLSGARLISREA